MHTRGECFYINRFWLDDITYIESRDSLMTTRITLVRTGLLQEVRMENDRVDQEINETLSMSINISCPQSIRHAVACGGVRVSQATTTIATSNFCLSSQLSKWLNTPRAHARARGYVIGRGVHILYICKKMSNFSPLSFKILTFRHPFQHRKASLRI